MQRENFAEGFFSPKNKILETKMANGAKLAEYQYNFANVFHNSTRNILTAFYSCNILETLPSETLHRPSQSSSIQAQT